MTVNEANIPCRHFEHILKRKQENFFLVHSSEKRVGLKESRQKGSWREHSVMLEHSFIFVKKIMRVVASEPISAPKASPS